jgi:MOB kinase activator 1
MSEFAHPSLDWIFGEGPGLLMESRFEYLWQDGENFKRPTKMPAPEYIEHLMAWVQSNIDNEQMFPSRIGM